MRELGLRLTANAAVQVVGTILSALVGLATFLALARGFGPAAYGDFAIATAYLSFPIVIADVGLTAGVLREISARPDRTEPAMRAFLPLSASLSAVIVALLVGIALVMPFADRAKLTIAIGSVGAFLTLMTLSTAPVLQARLEMHWAVAATVAGRLLTFLLVIAVLLTGLGFAAAVGAWVVGIAVSFAIQLAAVARVISIRPTIDLSYWRTLASGSIVLGGANALGQINMRMNTVLLGLFRPSAEVGYYAAAHRAVEVAHTTAGTVGITAFPPLARFLETGDPRFGRLIQRAFDVLLASAAPVMIVMVAFPEDILRWTAGPDFESGAVVLAIFAAFVPFAFINLILSRVLTTFHEDRLLMVAAASAVACTILLTVILVPPYGLEAAALITVGAEIVTFSCLAGGLHVRYGMFPSVRYGGTILAAAALPVLLVLVLPGPPYLVLLAAVVTYALAIAVAPGTVREIVLHLASTLRTRSRIRYARRS